MSFCNLYQKNKYKVRKYNKGYYIAHNHKKSNEAVKQTNTDKAVVIVEDKNSVVAELPAVKTIINTNVDEIKVENIPTKINEVKHNTILTDSKIVTASSGSAQIKPVHKVVSVQKKESKSSSDSDSQLILLVILSIFPFLALLAMYLKDGKQITLNFWVDLILHLTFIGYIIFALLVVFDIVNLA